MWLKIIGALFVIGACTIMGFQAAWRFAERPRQIRQLVSCLSALQSYIYYSSIPLSQALRLSADGVEGTVVHMFTRAAELLTADPALTPAGAFTIAKDEYSSKLTLADSEQELLVLFSSHLGMMNRDEQCKNLLLIQDQLEKTACEATAARDGNMKMYRYLGVCGGLAIVILLI